jgi:hypothetical protein
MKPKQPSKHNTDCHHGLFGRNAKKTVKKLSTNCKLFSVSVRLLLTGISAPYHLSATGQAMWQTPAISTQLTLISSKDFTNRYCFANAFAGPAATAITCLAGDAR